MPNGHATVSAAEYYHKEFHLDPTLAPWSSAIRNGEDFIKNKRLKKAIIIFVAAVGTDISKKKCGGRCQHKQ